MAAITSAIRKLTIPQSLTAAEARGAMEAIMEGSATPAQTAAFLVALKMKGETAEELWGMAKAMREECLRVEVRSRRRLADIVGTGGDRLKTFNVSTLACLIASGAGLPVAKHGNRSVTSRCGSADILEAFGVNIDAGPETVSACIEDAGIGFMFAPRFHPSMRHAMQPRREIGVKTAFNLLGPLTNPAFPRFQLVGVYDGALVEKMARVLLRLGLRRVCVVHGLVGVDEVSVVGKTLACEASGGRLKRRLLTPRDFGAKTPASLRAIRGGSLEENLRASVKILRGEGGAKTEMALVNAALALWVAGLAGSPSEGYERAREALESGKAEEKLRRLVERSGGNLERFREVMESRGG